MIIYFQRANRIKNDSWLWCEYQNMKISNGGMNVLSFENRKSPFFFIIKINVKIGRNRQLSCSIQTFFVTLNINNLCCRNQETPRNIKEYLQGGRDKIVSSDQIRVSWVRGEYELWLGERETVRQPTLQPFPRHPILLKSQTENSDLPGLRKKAQVSWPWSH